MRLPSQSYGIEVLDPNFCIVGGGEVLLRSAEGRRAWFMTACRSLEGFVLDAKDTRIPDAKVSASVVFPANLKEELGLGSWFQSRTFSAVTDGAGRFHLQRVSFGLSLDVLA